MTKEKLEELERVSRLYQPSSDSPATTGELLRLLEERNRLLEALHREHESDTGLSQESLADLAFAEAPADQVAERPKAT